MTRTQNERQLAISISGAELTLLKKLDFPCSEAVLATATPTEEGIELTGTRSAFESLAGWVAGEANHTRAKRRAEMLYNIAEALESALSPVFFR
jgi:hypothetical protein